jgi:hypothetical protein
MKACWATDPAKRPEFSKIVIELEKIIAEVEVLEFHQKIDTAVEDTNGRKFWKSCFTKVKHQKEDQGDIFFFFSSSLLFSSLPFSSLYKRMTQTENEI